METTSFGFAASLLFVGVPTIFLIGLFVSTKEYNNLVIVVKKILELNKNNPISHFKLAYAFEVSGGLSQSINYYN